MVAISPECPEYAASTAENNGLGFEVLSDYRNVVARQFGLVYQFPPDLIELYRTGFRNDLTVRNGTSVYELPMPATFVIARDGEIRRAFVDPDFTKRLEPSSILQALLA